MKLANCIQYTIFYSNHDDLTPSHSYALKLKSLEIAFGDGIVLLFTPFTATYKFCLYYIDKISNLQYNILIL